jgi:hypothetical protein
VAALVKTTPPGACETRSLEPDSRDFRIQKVGNDEIVVEFEGCLSEYSYPV